MTRNFRLDERALRRLINGPEGAAYLGRVGRDVRDKARVNARVISDDTSAIISEVGQDSEGIYTDVGYAKHHPGFYLWWWEVGTVNHRAIPHLRPALQPNG